MSTVVPAVSACLDTLVVDGVVWVGGGVYQE